MSDLGALVGAVSNDSDMIGHLKSLFGNLYICQTSSSDKKKTLILYNYSH